MKRETTKREKKKAKAEYAGKTTRVMAPIHVKTHYTTASFSFFFFTLTTNNVYRAVAVVKGKGTPLYSITYTNIRK